MCGFMCSEVALNFFMQIVAGFWNFFSMRKNTGCSLVFVLCVLHSWCARKHFYKKAMQSSHTKKYVDACILFSDNSLPSFPHSAFEWHM